MILLDTTRLILVLTACYLASLTVRPTAIPARED